MLKKKFCNSRYYNERLLSGWRIKTSFDIIMRMAEKNNTKQTIPVIRTFKSDAQKYVEEKKVSLINIFSKKSERQTGDFKKEKRFRTISILGTLIIFILISAALGLGYKIFFK